MLLIETDGKTQVFNPESNGKFSLDEIYKVVGDSIQLIPNVYVNSVPQLQESLLRLPPLSLVVNEEARPKGLQINPIASALAGREVYGPAVLATNESID